MAFPGFGTAAIETPGIPVPSPEFGDLYWLENIDAPAPRKFVVYDGLTCTVRRDENEGGRAEAQIVVLEDGTPGLQVRLTYEGVWDVFLVDSFEDSLCPGVNPLDPLGDVTRVFLGRGDDGSTVRLNRGHRDLGTIVEAFLRPNVVAPGGIGARCVFHNLYLAVEGVTGGLVKLVPVVDGELLTDEEVSFAVPSDGSKRKLQRFEIPLGRTHEVSGVARSRNGLVGTWFTFEATVLDAFGCGRLEFAGVELEYTVLAESIPGQTFTGESRQLPASSPVQRWYMGTVGGSTLQGGSSTEDGGQPIAVRIRSNEIAWAGVGGEALYQNIYLALTRANAADWDITVTPIMDDEELEPVSITLAGVASPVTEVLEISLAQTRSNGKSTYWPRGCWLAFTIESTSAPDKRVVFEGWSPEAEILTESLDAADA